MKLKGGTLPVAVRDSEERLSKGGVYLLETGLHLFLWVGASVQQELLANIFGTSSFSQLDPSMVRGNRSASMLRLLILVDRPTDCSSVLVCVYEGRPSKLNKLHNLSPMYHVLLAFIRIVYVVVSSFSVHFNN